MNNSIEIYHSQDGSVQLNVKLENETVWLSANQMAMLFDRDAKTTYKQCFCRWRIGKGKQHAFLTNKPK